MPCGKEDLVIPRWGHLPDEHPLPGLGRRPQHRPGRLAGRIKDRQAALKTVAAQAEGHRRTGPQQLLQNLQLHAGKIRKTVEIKRLVPGKIRLAQALGKIGQAVTGVLLLPGGADSIVALKDQAQLLQLSGKQALGLTGGTAQVRGRHTVALPLVHRCQQLRQERGPAAAGGIALEPGADLLQRLGHRQHAPALVQCLPGHAAGHGKDPVGKPGEAQHLGIAADAAAALVAQLLLRREGRLLRYDPDPLAVPRLAERRQERGPVCLPVLPPYDLQHRRTFFRV